MWSMWTGWTALLIIAASFIGRGDAEGCIPRSFGTDKIVCVCNATYCDGLEDNKPKLPNDGSFYWYVSNKGGLRLSMMEGKSSQCKPQSLNTKTIEIYTNETYQKILGFGAAMTDASGINIQTLSPSTQEQLIRTYYDPKVGSRYTITRVPIAGTDFSTRPYTYDDYHNDYSLEHFALAHEDYAYKIPYMHKFLKLNPNLTFFASPWSPPPWMKTNDAINGFGFLREDQYQGYANYILKFLEAYKQNGFDIWAVTTGNEPMNGLIPLEQMNSMAWTPKTVANWIGNNLGPTLEKSPFNHTKIIAIDDQRINFPWYIEEIFKNPAAKKYVACTAVHWYLDFLAPPDVLDQTHNLDPEKCILLTEACSGSEVLFPKVDLGSWVRGRDYILSIIEYMNHWAVAWTDWNLAVNKMGGPNWILNFADAAIVVNPENDEFFKQPMYYALTHFSRFVDRDSVRIGITHVESVQSTAFLTPSNEVVVVLYNDNIESTNIVLKDSNKTPLCLELSPHSMNTIIYAH